MCTKRNGGFTLIEMAVVLVIISMVAGGFLTLLTVKDEQGRIDLTKERLQRVEEALMMFYKKYHRLPCPAQRTIADDVAGFGVEYTNGASVCDDTQSPAGIAKANAAGAVDEVWIGIVPTRSLNLPDIYGIDGWNTRFTYAVVNDLAQSEALFTGYTNTTDNTGVIQILDNFNTTNNAADGNQITSNTLDAAGEYETNAYIIISHGKDRRGGFSTSGTAIKTCPTGASVVEESENCDGDDVFRDSGITDMSSTNVGYFYDYVRYKTRNQLVFDAASRNSLSGDIPNTAVVAFDQAGCPPGWTPFVSTAGTTQDAQGRVIVNVGDNGTTTYAYEDSGGVESTTLTAGNLPSGVVTYGATGAVAGTLSRGDGATSASPLGSDTAIDNRMPYIAMTYCKKL